VTPCTDLKFGEMDIGEMKRNTSNWSNFYMLTRRAGLTASAGLSCLHTLGLLSVVGFSCLIDAGGIKQWKQIYITELAH